MPDGSTRMFYLEAPNSRQGLFEWSITELPIQQKYRDTTKQLQKGYSLYHYQATLRYQFHYMFLTPLLVATNTKLKHPPGFESVDSYMETDCLLENEEAQKNYIQSLTVGMYTSKSERAANLPSGQTELRFTGRKAMTWDEVLDYYFYQRMDSSDLLASSDDEISNSDIVIHN